MGEDQNSTDSAVTDGTAEAMAYARAIEKLPERRRFASLLAFFAQLGIR